MNQLHPSGGTTAFIPAASPKRPTLHIFCRVVDNFGDIGVCWRLARQLVAGYQVTLWVDELPDFQQICREVNPALAWQTCFGVEVRHWSDCLPQDVPVADVVI